MSAPVRIEARAWGDLRFATLARLLGLADSDHALIKVARLWSWQTEHFTADQPTYVVDADTIESVLGAGGPAALVRARLATKVAGGYRLHGTEGQIEWCGDLSSTRQHAGRARAANARRDARGRLLPRESGEPDYQSPAPRPANVQQLTSSLPAQSSAPTPSPSPEDQKLSLPRDPTTPAPDTQAPAVPPGESAWHRRARWWGAMLEADARIRAAGIEPNAPSLPKAPAGANELNMSRCERQLLDGGATPDEVDAKMRHIVLVAEAEALREGHRRWFKPAMIWDPERAARAVDTSLAEASRRPAKPGAKVEQPPRKPDPGPPAIVSTLTVEERLALAAESRATLGIADGARAPPASARPTDTDEKPATGKATAP